MGVRDKAKPDNKRSKGVWVLKTYRKFQILIAILYSLEYSDHIHYPHSRVNPIATKTILTSTISNFVDCHVTSLVRVAAYYFHVESLRHDTIYFRMSARTFGSICCDVARRFGPKVIGRTRTIPSGS